VDFDDVQSARRVGEKRAPDDVADPKKAKQSGPARTSDGRQDRGSADCHRKRAGADAIASRFEELTQGRHESAGLTKQLCTERLVATGAVGPTKLISVGTREQLPTVYR
jgi:hypothetical protein